MRRFLLLAAGAVALSAASPGLAQTITPPPAEFQTAAQPGDAVDAQEFVEKATMSNMFEIESSTVALDRGESIYIKDFARQMIDDHGKAGDELKAVLASARVEMLPPARLDDEHQSKIDQLSGLSGREFDLAFIDMQVEGHEKAVELFRNYAAGGDNEALKAFAAKTLPVIELHYGHITQMQKNVRGTM